MKKVVSNVYNSQYAFSVVSKVLGVLIGFAYSIVYSRYFGANLRGEVDVITNYLGIFYIFLCIGMYQAYPFYRKEVRKEEIRGYYIGFINDTFGMFGVYTIISLIVVSAVRMEPKFIVVALLLPSEFLVKQMNYIVLIENPKLRNLTGIGDYLFELLFVLFLWILIKAEYWTCILFVAVKQLITFGISIWSLKIKISEIRPKLSKNIWKYIRYGFIPMLSVLLTTANYKIDVIMLDRSVNISSAEIGLYSLGVSLAERVWMIPDALKDILLSKLSKL